MSNFSNYPQQAIAIKRTHKVLGVDTIFDSPAKDDCPLKMHSGYSRAVLTLVDNSENAVKTPKANIPATEIPYIKEATRIAIEQVLNKNSAPTTENDLASRPAYTQKLFDKNHKGKTPAEVLLENPDEKEALKKTRDWLNANADKYKANKAQVTAIDDALALLEIGELKPITTTGQTFTIYNTDYKFMTQKNEKGYNLIYSISVMCDPTRDYPIILSITNCFAPVQTAPTGQKTIQMGSAENTVKSSLAMTLAEWFSVVDRIIRNLDNFEAMTFARQYDMAQKEYLSHFKK